MSDDNSDPGHGNSPAAWTAVTIMLVAFTVGTVAFWFDQPGLVAASGGLLVVANGKMALELLEQHEVDIVISDISMPEVDGFELINSIRKKYPNISTLVLSMHSEPMIIAKLIKQNVNGYLLKNAEKEELLKAISLLASGENYFSEQVKNIYIESSFNRNKKDVYIPELSKREKEVLKLIIEECTAKEIAEKLCISQHTVESHRKNIFSKLNVKNVAGVVKYAFENDLVN